jgi:integrase
MSQSTAPHEPVIRSAGADDPVHHVIGNLPPLPSVIRYYDEFEDIHRSIPRPLETKIFEVWINGTKQLLDFTQFSSDDALLLKHVFLLMLGKDRRIETISNYFLAARDLTHDDMVDITAAGPTRIGLLWSKLRARNMTGHAYSLVKMVLRLLCQYRLQGWSNEYLDLLSATLPLPAHDKFAAVRSGDAFLSIDEEAAIVRHLDATASSVAAQDRRALTLAAIADAGMLLCAFQFAMRPVQIARLAVRNVRIWNGSGGEKPSIHLTFHMAKQKSSATRKPLTRRVKQDWAPIFLMLEGHGRSRGLDRSTRLFGVNSSAEARSRIAKLVKSLTGANRSANGLRHSAAQRLVDAGANHEELAEFMGHSDVRTGLVYYEASSTQAERVNKALGLSTIYRAVAKIAHDRFITLDELTRLKDDQQIAGVPHGMPIAGIGGCTSGQPACPYNPITSCYGCRKFMPVQDKAVHERVLGDFRSVVTLFQQSSRGDANSPAYLQLQRTINDVKIVIEELEGGNR